MHGWAAESGGGHDRAETSRFLGVSKDEAREAKPWMAQINIREDGQCRATIGDGPIHFAQEEDAARAYDRAIACPKLGHAEATTNFPAVLGVAAEEARWNWCCSDPFGDGHETTATSSQSSSCARRPTR